METTTRGRWLRGALWLNLALLAVVFVLGMMVNLYIAFPSNLKIDAMQFAAHTPSLQTHMIVATAILVIGLVALVLSLVERHVWAIVSTLAGLALALVAYSGGMMFLTNGYQESASLMMAVGFIGAFIAYGVAAFVAAPRAALAAARRA